MFKNYILIAVFLTIIIGLALEITGFVQVDGNYLSGDDLGNISANDLDREDLIIYVRNGTPGKLDDKYGYPLNDIPKSVEKYYIFGDGTIFVDQGYNSQSAYEEAKELGQIFDTNWVINKTEPGGALRRIIVDVSVEDIIELLNYLSNNNGEFAQGETVADHPFGGYIRVLYNGREGLLYEQVATRLTNQVKLDFIYSFIDLVRAKIANGKIGLVELSEWPKKLEAKKAEFAWFDTQIHAKYGGLREAWDANGIQYTSEGG